MKETDGIPLGTVVAGRYRVQHRLGEGGMGSVYAVEHVHTGQELALKVLNPKMVRDQIALERFRREARAPARIQSDHVVQVTDADVAPELGGVPFLVMELLRGQSFDQLLEHRMPQVEALLYLQQMARALDKAASLGIVHRDIKPENLILTRREDGTPCVKLLDFGIAKLTQGSESVASKTATGAIFGTPLYMAPEQILGQPEKICAQTDIWALGIMAHRMLVGIEPWTAETLPHLVAQIAYEPLPVPSERGSRLGGEFDRWFARCCARRPEDRFATASEAVSALALALGEEAPMVSSGADLGTSAPRISSRRGSTKDAFAATAVAGAHSAIGSDTLSAQVTTKKGPNKLVVAGGALLAGLVLGGIWMLVQGTGAKGEAAGPAPAATREPTVSAPAEPSATKPQVEPTTSPEVLPTASVAPTQSSKPPVKPVVGSGPKPPPTTTSTGGAKDPLDMGRK
ncbi:MAG: serine/threonine protein kinase [Polyangiaceae bacterium]|nr:serine/threonine protein kinase [Polyangiaceae bacterium]MCE7894844.1 serine/threonine protein kinase [Sorangiineae bacterium PRO1]